jgi:hypothetical protein
MKFICALLLAVVLPATLPAADASLFSSNPNATRESFRKLCDYIATQKKDVATIYTAGYYMRDLVAGYRIFGEKRYLDVAIQYADGLLNKQADNGYWGTGYGRIYLADTGSAIGLFIALYDHVDAGRRRQYLQATQRFVDAIKRDGLILPSGAMGVGLYVSAEGKPQEPWRENYTISSALTGAEVFIWMYRMTGKEEYQTVAYRSLAWIMSTMRSDGLIPYVVKVIGGDYEKKGDPQNDYKLWDWLPYLTSAYVGEGVVFFDKYATNMEWKKEIRGKLRPHIEYLVSTQSPEGIWNREKYQKPADRAFDLTRTPGIVNLLIWYDLNVKKDERIAAAVRKFEQYFTVPEQAKAFGMLTAGATLGGGFNQNSLDSATSLVPRAIADIVRPGVDVP